MKRRLSILCLGLGLLWGAGCAHPQPQVRDVLPPIYPDYTQITIPANIAPLHFQVEDSLGRTCPLVDVVASAPNAKPLHARGKRVARWPLERWRALLKAATGSAITVTVTALVDGRPVQFAPFTWDVAPELVDPFLSYRLIEPGYEVWYALQLKERNVTSFRERTLADNNLTERSCMNCHTYGSQDSQYSFFHLRGAHGGTVLNQNGALRKLTLKPKDGISAAVYGDLHPNRRTGVFSTNTIIPAFHGYKERFEVYDAESDLILVDFNTEEVTPFPTYRDGDFRTFPVFSADGRHIYYCYAPHTALPDSIRSLRYDLLSLPFDPQTGLWSTSAPDTLYSARRQGRSVCHPKASPDGHYVLFTLADYGTFPIWHQETDLYLLNLQTRALDSLPEANSPTYSDTYHSWSSNSRWFVFASKRDDGLYGKPYFCYVDAQGHAHKPFVLPQKDPMTYRNTLKSFNIPELSKGALPFDARAIEKLYWDVP